MSRIAAGKVYYYRITVIEHNGKTHEGIRDHISSDIDMVWTIFKRHAEEAFGSRMEDFNCVQLSKHSREVSQYLRKGKISTITNVPEENWYDVVPPASTGPRHKTRKQLAAESSKKYPTLEERMKMRKESK